VGAQATTLNEQPYYELPARATQKLSDAERDKLLDRVLVKKAQGGGTVQMRGGNQVVLEYKAKPNHLLHLILSILTLGLWLVVWLIVAITSRDKHETIAVDEYGVVTSTGRI
jgi:hypothetical protein